jgi:hypothetical protein
MQHPQPQCMNVLYFEDILNAKVEEERLKKEIREREKEKERINCILKTIDSKMEIAIKKGQQSIDINISENFSFEFERKIIDAISSMGFFVVRTQENYILQIFARKNRILL